MNIFHRLSANSNCLN